MSKPKHTPTPPQCCFNYGDPAEPSPGKRCPRAATWGARGSNEQFDMGTEACDDHLGHLLNDSPTHAVWPLSGERILPDPNQPRSLEARVADLEARVAAHDKRVEEHEKLVELMVEKTGGHQDETSV